MELLDELEAEVPGILARCTIPPPIVSVIGAIPHTPLELWPEWGKRIRQSQRRTWWRGGGGQGSLCIRAAQSDREVSS